MLSRDLVNVKIDEELLQRLTPNCVILDLMQRSEPLITCNGDHRLAGYRQAENGLFVRMALLQLLMGS